MTDHDQKFRQNFNIISPHGEKIFTRPGNRGDHDMKIYVQFPESRPFPISLFCTGWIVRLKGLVEERNYPPPRDGAKKIQRYLKECLFERQTDIIDLCVRHKIPGIESRDNHILQHALGLGRLSEYDDFTF